MGAMKIRAFMPICALLLAAAAAPSEGGNTSALPQWMSGGWEQVEGGAWTEESWTLPRAGMMIGLSRSGEGERLAFWEMMRIERTEGGAIVFQASPKGAPASAFPMVSQGPDEIVFANPAHDYPQRIRYWREGETLRAEISKMDGSEVQSWTYRRAAR